MKTKSGSKTFVVMKTADHGNPMGGGAVRISEHTDQIAADSAAANLASEGHSARVEIERYANGVYAGRSYGRSFDPSGETTVDYRRGE